MSCCAASAEPPVAIRSSTTTTFWPSVMAFSCISNVSTPYCTRAAIVSAKLVRRIVKETSARESERERATHLLLVLRLEALAGELALLADGDERGAEAEREDRAEQEAARVEADDRVNLGVRVARRLAQGGERDGREVVQEVGDEGLRGGVERGGSASSLVQE